MVIYQATTYNDEITEPMRQWFGSAGACTKWVAEEAEIDRRPVNPKSPFTRHLINGKTGMLHFLNTWCDCECN